MEANGSGLRLYLIGHPVSHSLSPAIYNRLLAETGVPGEYKPLDVDDESKLASTIEYLRLNSEGFNVTVPYKIHAARLVDELDVHAEALGAVNTVKIVEGRLLGYNTDWLGIHASLSMHRGASYSTALIIGAGGSARAAAYALTRIVDELLIVSRSGVSAVGLAEKAAMWGIPRVQASAAERGELKRMAARADLIINASPVGLGDPDATPLPGEYLPRSATVLDLVYKPLKTRLLREAEGRGCRVIDGLWVLAHQAAWNAWIWLGHYADPVKLRLYALQAIGGVP